MIDVDIKKDGLEFEEFTIETDYEREDVTKTYLREARRGPGESEEDLEEDEIETAFVERAMTGLKVGKVAEQEEGEQEDDVEAKELEKIIEDKHANYSKISRTYKLFEFVARSEPQQVLRYVKTRSSTVPPLWASERGLPTSVPACPRCGSPRLFEC